MHANVRVLLLIGCRLLLGGIFLWSGLVKIRQPYDFLSSVYSYALVSDGVGMIAAFVIPWIELTIGAALLGGCMIEGGFCIATLLLSVFVVAKWSAVHRDLKINCGCQVVSTGEVIGIADVITTGLLLAAAVFGLWLARLSRIANDASTIDSTSKSHSGESLALEQSTS